jgi:hypothetical protein
LHFGEAKICEANEGLETFVGRDDLGPPFPQRASLKGGAPGRRALRAFFCRGAHCAPAVNESGL